MPPSEAIERNLQQVFRHFACARESGEVREMPGVSIASCGVAFHMFNAAFLSEPVTARTGELERRIATAAVHFGARGLRWAFWVSESKLGKLLQRRAQAIFHKHGLGLASQCPGMLVERPLPPVKPLPALEVRRVKDELTRLAFCHISSLAFRIPFQSCRELYDLESLWTGDFAGYVGYANGQPVTTAATLVAAGAVGIYSVATLPDYERSGYAETIVRYALARARETTGLERSALQSTAVAVPLYRRMGYEVVTRFAIYTS